MAFYSDRFCFEFSREKQYVKDLAKCVIFWWNWKGTIWPKEPDVFSCEFIKSISSVIPSNSMNAALNVGKSLCKSADSAFAVLYNIIIIWLASIENSAKSWDHPSILSSVIRRMLSFFILGIERFPPHDIS